MVALLYLVPQYIPHLLTTSSQARSRIFLSISAYICQIIFRNKALLKIVISDHPRLICHKYTIQYQQYIKNFT